MTTLIKPLSGLALIDKPPGKTSFYLVNFLRRLTSVKCIGHAGTLDPFATGVMVMLVGKPYTKKANQLISLGKEYEARVKLGVSTDSFDIDGSVTFESPIVPTLPQIEDVLTEFQGEIFQTPPMFSAKKINGQKLYNLARAGKTIEREAKKVYAEVNLVNYAYPYLDIYVTCSSGTYIRAIADDIGSKLQSGAHLVSLKRTKVGPFNLSDCQSIEDLESKHSLILKGSW
jgi:tRNA pseudouridine55 synthase